MQIFFRVFVAVSVLTSPGLAMGSSYPALDFLRTQDSYTSSGWFNCGLQPAVSTSTGSLQLKVVSVRGAGSCSSSDVYSLTCEKYRNRCTRGSTVFTACTNGDFNYGGRYARGFYYGDMIADCEPVPDHVAAPVQVGFADSTGKVLDYVLPGGEYDLVLKVKNETQELLTDYRATVVSSGVVEVSMSVVSFGDLPPGGEGSLSYPVKIKVPADTCSQTFSLKIELVKDQRRRSFTRFFSVGKPVYGPTTISLANVPVELKSDGTTTMTLPALGDRWPYAAKIFKASFRSRINHQTLGEISRVALTPPGGPAVTLFRGDGKRSGTQSNAADITDRLQGKVGWGDWTLTSTEKDWQQSGSLQSFSLEMVPAVFNCHP